MRTARKIENGWVEYGMYVNIHAKGTHNPATGERTPAPHAEHPLWKLRDGADRSKWKVVGIQKNGSVLPLTCTSTVHEDGNYHEFQAESGKHRDAGEYVRFEVWDGDLMIQEHNLWTHPVPERGIEADGIPLPVAKGDRLRVIYGVREMVASAPNEAHAGTSVRLMTSPPKTVETE